MQNLRAPSEPLPTWLRHLSHLFSSSLLETYFVYHVCFQASSRSPGELLESAANGTDQFQNILIGCRFVHCGSMRPLPSHEFCRSPSCKTPMQFIQSHDLKLGSWDIALHQMERRRSC